MTDHLDWEESDRLAAGTGPILLMAATALYWSMLWVAGGFAPIAFWIAQRRRRFAKPVRGNPK